METKKGNARRRAGIIAAPLAIAALLIPAGSASAERYYTNAGAATAAEEFVNDEYPDVTDLEMLEAACRGQGTRRPNPRFKYRKNVCAVYDHNDDTYIVVVITGRPGRGAYSGRILSGWQDA